MATETIIKENKQTTTAKSVDFGNGRYSAVAMETYRDAIRVIGLPASQAEKLARSLASDLGRQNFQATMNYGKTTSKGTATLREVATAKGVVETYAISLARFINTLDNARKGVCPVETSGPVYEVTLREEITQWLAS